MNCMDCLDRTNVVQSVLARWSLRQQVQVLFEGGTEGGKEGGKKLTGGKEGGKEGGREGGQEEDVLQLPFEGLEKGFRSLWGGNADAISVLSAGTPALKGDFTRTGKRTKAGMVSDGLNSAKRYVINNFVDSENQRAVEALLGRTREGGRKGRGEGWVVWPVEEGREKEGGREEGAWRKVVVEKGGLEGGEEELDRLLAEVVPPLREGERVGKDGRREGRANEEEEEGEEGGREEEEELEKWQGEVKYYDEDMGGLSEWEREEREEEESEDGEEEEEEEEGEEGEEGGKERGWDVYLSEEMARDAAANAAQG